MTNIEHADDAALDQHQDDMSARMAKAITIGFVVGTPITFVVFFAILYWIANVDLTATLITAAWVAIVGGGFYGAVAGLLGVLNRSGH